MNCELHLMSQLLNVENEFLIKTKIELEKNIADLKLDVNDLKKKTLRNLFSKFYTGQQQLNDMLETHKLFLTRMV